MARTRTPLAGRSVLITGAARGIGAALARKAAARGARVALVGLEPELLAKVADELGPEHLWVECDVTDPEALKAAVERTVQTFGGLDVVVANAGIAPLTTVMTSTAQALARTIEINLIGSMLTAHAALPEIAKRRGHVLLISSAAASVTSASTHRCSGPSSSATAASSTGSRPTRATRAPRAAHFRASSAPIPRAAPVISTACPASGEGVFGLRRERGIAVLQVSWRVLSSAQQWL